MEKSEIIKNVITVATPFITTITNTFVKPKIAELAKTLDLKKKNFEHIIENKFNQYLINSYEKYSIINTIVFHNQQKLLKELYIPLTVVNSEQNSFVIENFDIDFIPFFQRVLITDTAGMGKSTILKRLFLSIIDEGKGIPLLIELRRLSKTKDIIDEIIEQLSTITEIPDKKFVLQLIQKGDFIFLFDGFDEIPLENRRIITKQIQNFINKANNNCFVITSRPESALASFGDFKEFEINPLQKEEAFTLLRKYDALGTLAKLLIKKLQEKQYKNIDEFLTNPLLVSLLFAAFEHKQTIPLKKHIFYRQVYDALFESHDLTKGDSFIREKFSKLDIDEFHKVLRHLGYNCIIKGKIEFTKDEILNLISEAKEFSTGLEFKESDFLKDLINTVPLFSIDGIYYKWSHKSLQEYFAAQFIFLDSKEKQNEILTRIYNHDNIDRFINLLDLYYSIDYKSFSEVITYNLLTDYLKHLKTSYKNWDTEYALERKKITYSREFAMIYSPYDFDDDNSPNLWQLLSTDSSDEIGWGIPVSIISDHKKVNHIKLFSQPKPVAILLDFLHDKKEDYIINYQSVTPNKNILKGLDELKVYYLSDDKNSILNSIENFKITNNLIIKYTGRYNFTIDEAKAHITLNKIKKSIRSKSYNKLLDF